MLPEAAEQVIALCWHGLHSIQGALLTTCNTKKGERTFCLRCEQPATADAAPCIAGKGSAQHSPGGQPQAVMPEPTSEELTLTMAGQSCSRSIGGSSGLDGMGPSQQ